MFKHVPAIGGGIAAVILYLACVVLYILNLGKAIFAVVNGDLFEFVVRMVGVFMWPLGIIFGIF